MPKYTVKRGDSLSLIAARLKMTWQALFARNKKVIGANPDVLKPGQKLAYGPVTPKAPEPRPKVRHRIRHVLHRKPKPTASQEVVTTAVRRAVNTTRCQPGTCDHVTAGYYGCTYSGYVSAYQNWVDTPTHYRHPGDLEPPAGAACFWYGGPEHYGHAALSLGLGRIRCTDMDANGNYAPGQVSTIRLTDVSARWGLQYLGATDPFFQGRLFAKVY